MIGDQEYIRPILEFWANWAELQDGDRLPTRQAINPSRFIRLLPEITIYEVELPERITVRLAGTAVQRRWKNHYKGHNLLDTENIKEHEQLSERFGLVVNTPCGLYRRLCQTFVDGSETFISSLMLPLADANSEDGRFVLAIHHMEGVLGMRSTLPAMGRCKEMTLEQIDLGLSEGFSGKNLGEDHSPFPITA